MALVVTILVLLTLIMICGVLASNSVTHSKLAGIQQRRSRALDLAEAGVSEAVARISSTEVPANLNPRMVTQIFNTASGNVPVLGTDSTSLATAQPAGTWLGYSADKRGPDVLTVRYKTDAARTLIYKYDPTKNPPIQTASGYPIYEITATGRVGDVVRRIMTDVVAKPFNMNIRGALASKVPVKFSGNAFACGFNHRPDTPNGTGVNGQGGLGGCNEDPSVQHWEVGGGTSDKTGIWSASSISSNGASSASGSPPQQGTQTGFYNGPWEALGMTQADFVAWVGARSGSVPANLNDVLYLDNNNVRQDQSGTFSVTGSGAGFLYVDGDLIINGSFNYRGLIYVEGNVKLNGQAWILGGLVVRGKAETKFNGGATLLYSQDAIAQNLARYGGSMTNLAWRELQ
jgi:Tfp pilus assembly protein PilX